MKLLITGGAGFIGSHLVEHYLKQHHQVIVIDNFITGREQNMAGFRQDTRFRFIKDDVIHDLQIDEPVDAVLHLASPASPVDYLKHPIETVKTSSVGTLNVLEYALRYKARFLLASTSEVYGDPLVHPQPEEYWGNVNPIGPRSVYDEAKRFGEAATMAYHRQFGLDTHIARIFNTYGPRMRADDGRVVPTFLVNALRGEALPVFGDGRQSRSFCYISDLVEGLSALAESDFHEPVNLGNPAEFTVAELAGIVTELVGSKSQIAYHPLPQDDPKKRCPDISRAKKILGWQPKVQLKDGLKAVLDWYGAQGDERGPNQ